MVICLKVIPSRRALEAQTVFLWQNDLVFYHEVLVNKNQSNKNPPYLYIGEKSSISSQEN